MNKIILEKLIYKNYLKTALTSILFIEIALIIIYFSANTNIINASINFILEDIKKSVYSRVEAAKTQVAHKFEDVEILTSILQNEHQNFFTYQDKIISSNKVKFDFSPNGMFYKVEDNGGSSVVVSKETRITNEIKRKLQNTELFDKSFKHIVENNPIIVAAYFNSHDDLNRYYPFIPNAYDTFPTTINMQNYNFYYEADIVHNPEKKVVWTDVYLDPAGQGWMLSAIVPIYNKGFLEGVTGLDVTLESIIKGFLDFKLPYNGSSFLIDDMGNIVAMTKEIEEMLKIKNTQEYVYSKGEKIKRTVIKDDMKRIYDYDDKAFVQNLKNIIEGKEYFHDIVINDKKYILFSQKIDKLSWYVISLIDENEILSDVRELENHHINLGYVIIIFIVFFYFLFFIYLYLKSKEFVKTINEPLQDIIEVTKNLGSKKEVKELKECGIEEIDILNSNFNTLAHELESRTKKLIKSETTRAFHEKLANTDPLTGVYNRRYLEEFSKNYMKIVKREKGSFSLLLIDIDNFKTINDSFGHDIGDIIIKSLVKRVRSIIRENDMIVRHGGDEFIVLLPNTNKENAREVAQKLIFSINTLNKLENKELRFTITIGCSEFEVDDTSINPIIKRADEALYKAKGQGKNCVV